MVFNDSARLGVSIASGNRGYRGSATLSSKRRQAARPLAVLLASAALLSGAPVAAAGLDLGGATAMRSTLAPFDSFENGYLKLTLLADETFAGTLIDGAGTNLRFDKLGTGNLTLTGANTLSGQTSILAGTLFTGAVNTLSANSRLRIGATLDLSGYSQVVKGFYAGGFILNSAGGDARLTTVNEAGITSTFTGSIAETAGSKIGLVKAGAGTQNLTGSNSFTGGIEIQTGILGYGSSASLGGNGNLITFTGTGVLKATSAGLTIGNDIHLDVDGRLDGGGLNPTFSGVISGAGALIKIGGGGLVLTGANTYAGGTTLTSGRLFANSGSLGTGTLTVAGNSNLGSVAGGSVLSNQIQLDGRLDVILPTAAVFELSGVIAGTKGILIDIGTGTLLLSGANTYAGETSIGTGTLAVANAAAIGGGSGSLYVSGPSTLQANASLTLNNTVRNGSAFKVDTNGFDLTITGAINNASGVSPGSLTKSGAGTLTLAQANTYSGGTTLQGGTLSVGDNNMLGALAGSLNFTGGNLRVTGSNFATTFRSITLSANGGLDIADPVNNFVITTSITGAGTLTKLGAGNLLLAVANPIGGFDLQAGSVVVSDDGGLGTGNIHLAGGTLVVPTDVEFINTVTLGTTKIDTGSNNLTLSGLISDDANNNGSFEKLGSGNLILSQSNGFSGGATIHEGIVVVKSNFALGNGTTIFDGGTNLTAGATVTLNNPLTFNAGVVVVDDGGNVLTLSGSIDGAGSLAKPGSGTLVLNGANAFTGGTALDAGTLVVGSNTALGNAAGVLDMAQGTTLRAGATVTLANAIALAGTGATIDADTFDLATSSEVSGATALLTKTGAGILTLAAFNTYGGGTALKAGTINFDDNEAFGGGIITVDTGILGALGAHTLLNDVVVNTSATIALNNFAVVLDGDISGAGGLVVTGGGSLALNGTNGFAGGAVVSLAEVFVGSDTALGANGVTLGSAVTLTNVSGATRTLDNDFVLNGPAIKVGGGTSDVVLTGDISGAFGFTKSTSNTLTLSGINSGFTGDTFLDAGRIVVTTSKALGDSKLTFADATTLGLGATGLVLTNGLEVAATDTANLEANGTFTSHDPATGAYVSTGAVTTLSGALTGAGEFDLNGYGQTTLNGANAGFMGEIVVTGLVIAGNSTAFGAGGGTLTLNANSGLQNGAGADLTLATGVTLAGTGHFIGGPGGSNNLTLSGVITGAGDLEKVGVDTLTLTGASDYAGDTTISAGTLVVDGLLNGFGLVKVLAGATLTGNGSIAGDVAVIGGTIAATAGSQGLLVFDVGFDANSHFAVQLGAPSATALLTVANDISITNGAVVDITALPGFSVGTYRLIDYAGNRAGTFSVGQLPGGYVASNVAIDVSVANQISLMVNTGGVLYWDGNGPVADGTVDGGNGTWNAANTNWTDMDGNAQTPWGSATGIFQGAAGEVIVASPLNFDVLYFKTDGYLLSDGGGSLIPSIFGEIKTDGGVKTTINATIGGANGLIKSGEGTLVLGGTNTFLGDVSVLMGTLQITNIAALGQGIFHALDQTTIILDTGFGNDIDLGGNAPNGPTFQADVGVAMLSGAISGTGSLIKTGLGELLLSGANAYAGGTFVNAGIVRATNADAFGGGPIAIADGAELAASATLTLVNDISLTGVASIGPSNNELTLSGTISGTGRLFKTDSGTLILTGANSYVGTTIDSGTLSVGSDTNLGDAAGNIVFGTGASSRTLALTNNFTSARDIVFNANSAIDSGNFDVLLSGVVSGDARLAKTGTGTLTLSGTNTYGGGTRVEQGTLSISSDANLGAAAGDVRLGDVGVSGATLEITGGLTSARSFAIVEDSVFNTVGSSVALINGVISSDGLLTKQGTGTLALSGNNSGFSGGIVVAGGTLSLRSNNAAGTGTITTTGSVIDYADGVEIANAIAVDSNTTQLQVVTGEATQSGVISELNGPRPLEKIGAGTLVLAGANSFSGLFSIDGGKIGIANASALGTGSVALGTGTSLQVRLAGLTLANDIALAGTSTIDTNGLGLFPAVGLTLGGVLSGTALNKIGEGNLSLTGTNTYTGGTFLNAGRISIGADENLGAATGAFKFQSAAVSVLATSGDFASDRNLIVSNAQGVLATVAGSDIVWNGVISGMGSLIKAGSGTLTLTNTGNSYLNTIIADGTLFAGSNAVFGTGSILFVSTNTGILSLTANVTINRLVDFVTGGTIDTQANAVTLSNTVRNVGSLTKIGSGVLSLTHANIYTGDTNLNAGTIAIGSGTALGVGGKLNLANGTTLQAATAALSLANGVVATGASTIDTQAFNLTLAGLIDGTGSLTKTGSGDLTLANANLYDGGTTVTGGTLVLGSNTAAGDGTIALANGTRLRFGATGLNVANQIALTGLVVVQPNNFVSTLSGVVGGTGTLRAADAGTLILTNAQNTYSGGTSLTGGVRVQVSSDGNLGAAAGGVTFENGGGTLALDGAVTSARTVALTADGTIESLTGVDVLSGVISGTGVLTKTGSAKLSLNGANTYTGGTLLNDGTIAVGTSTALGSGLLSFTGGRTLQAGAAGLIVANGIKTSGIDNVDTNGFDLTLSGVVADSGSINKIGAGTLTLANANTYLGGTTLVAGGITVGTNTSLGGGTLAMSGGTRLNAGTTGLVVANNVTTAGVATIDAGTGTFELSGIVSGAGSLTKVNTGTLTLSGANTYAGGTDLSAGKIRVTNNQSIGTGTLTTSGGTTLTAGAPTLAFDNTVVLNGATTIDLTGTQVVIDLPAGSYVSNGSNLTLSGNISGAGSLATANFGTLTLSGDNSFTGGVTATTANVFVTRASSLGTGTLALNDRSGLRNDSGGSVSLDNAVVLSGTNNNIGGSRALTLTGAISGNAGFTKAGTDTLTLSGTSTYTGVTTVGSGTLNVNGALNGGGAVNIGGDATLTGIGSIAGLVTIANGGIIAPGNSPGTLTVGALNLSNASLLNFDLGEANKIGGAFNDRIVVTNDLTLDGLLSVADSNVFGIGVYNLITYGGALTDNGLQVASLPGAFTGQIQTLVAHQVNLIVTTPGTLVQYWDAAPALGDGIQSGGTGLWSTNSTNWTGEAPAEINANWQGGVGVFGGTAGTVTILSPQAFQGLQFVTDGYLLQSLFTGGLTIAGPSFVSVGAGLGATISAPISGAGSLKKQSLGTLTLNGTNTYTGGTSLEGGGIVVGTNSALGTGTLAMAGGTALAVGTSGLVLANLVTTAAVATINSGAGSFELHGAISGAGSLTKTGSGTLILSAANTYAGGTALTAGTIRAGTATALGSGTLTFTGGTTLQAGAALTIGNALVTAGTDTVDTNGFDLTLSGLVSGSGSIAKIGGGTLTLDHANTYIGGTTLQAGALTVTTNTSLGGGTLAMAGGTRLNAGITGLVLANAVTTAGIATIDSGAGTFGLAGSITGAGSLTKVGGGTLILTGTNGYTGGTALTAGTIRADTGSALGTGTLTFTGGTTLQAGATISLVNALTLAGVDTVDTNGFDLTLTGAIDGSGTLHKTSAGTLTLNSASTYTGGTTLAAGAITVGNNTALGTSTLAMAAGTRLNAGAPGLNIANAVTTAGVATIDSGAGLFTLSGNISGAGSIAKISSGTLSLTAGNDYTGGTALTAGTLRVGANTALGTGTLTFTGGTTLQAGIAATLANAIVTSGLDTIDTQTFALTLTGQISGDGSLNKSGSSNLILTGANTYTGGTKLNAGVIVVANNTALGTNTLTMADTTVLTAGISGLVIGNAVTLNGLGIIVSGPGTFELHGPISGGLLAKIGTGTLILSGNNNYAGGTALNVGTIRADTATALGTGTLTFTGGTTLQAGAALTLANTVNTAGIDTVDTNGFDLTLTGLVAGAGQVNKVGGGTLTLDHANTYGGGTTLAAGGITVTTNTSLGGGTLAMAGGTRLNAGVPALVLANAVTTAGVATIASGTGSFTLAGPISGAGSLTKVDTGTLILAGNNGYAGGTALTAGRIIVKTNTALGTGALTFTDGTILEAGNSLVLSNALVTAGLDTVATASFDLTLNGLVSGTGAIVKTGNGSLTISNANTYSGGTVLTQGTIVAGNNLALGSGTLLSQGLTTLKAGIDGLTLANAISTTNILVVDSQSFVLTLDGPIAGAGQINKVGSGNLILNGDNSYANGTLLQAGTITVGTSTALGGNRLVMADATTLRAGAADLAIANNITTNGVGTIANSFDLTLSGGITGPGGIVKAGAGTLTLTGASNYTGATSLTAGKTLVNGSLDLTAVTVFSGATLGGSGSIAGSVDVLDGGILAAGNPLGTFTLGSLTLHDASIVNAQLGAANTIGGAFNDLVKVTGNLTLDGQLNVIDTASFGLGIYELFSYGGTLTDNGLNIASLPGTTSGIVQTLVPGQVNLVITAPGTLVQYWDGADGIGNGAISGGSGIWSTLGTNWTGAPPSQLNANWQGGIAVFQGTAGTVTLNAPQTFRGLQFAVDGYTLAATGTGGLVTASNAFVAVSTGASASITAPISGSGSIVKQGGGTLNLSGANSYAGGTDLQLGTLGIGSNTALGSGTLAMNGGTTLVANVGGLTVANSITTAGIGTIDSSATNLTLAGAISGAGSIVKTGAGTLVLNAASSYAGGTALTSGQITVGNSAALGTGTLAMADATRLNAGITGLVVANAVTTAGVGTIDSGSGTFSLTGAISGAGSLTKVGSGTLLLSGNNSFVNANVSTGTLAVGSNTAAGSGTLALATGTTLQAAVGGVILGNAVGLTGATTVDTQQHLLTLTGVVGGTGSLTKVGTGTLSLTNANTYSGGTTIAAGTVAIGTATALGTGTLTFNAGTLQADAAALNVANVIAVAGSGIVDTQANVFTLSGTTSGTGGLTKIGTGTLILAGASTRTGPTTITAGTLSGSVATFGTGAIIDNAALVFNQGIDATYGAPISGTGTVNKAGVGNLTLTGSSNVSGATAITAGRLTVAGALTASTVTVGTGTTLAGTGSIFGLVAANGSTVSPGATDGAVGTLSVTGPATFQTGSTLAINVTPTTADRLTIGGAASLAGNLTLTAATGQYFFNTSYTLLSAASITGTYTPPALTLFGPAFAPTLTYSGTTLVLKLVPNSLVKLLGGVGSQNVLNTASAFDRATAAGFNPQAFYSLYLQGAALGASINQLTGEIHSADRRTAIADTRYVREAALDRLGAGIAGGSNGGRDATTAQASGDRVTSGWARAIGSWTNTDSDGNGAKLDINAKGILAGIDTAADNLTFGALFSYIDSDVDTRILGKSTVKTTGGGLYAGYRAPGGFAFGAGGSVGSVKSKTNRAITVPGLTQSLVGHTSGTAYQLFGDLSYDLAAAENTRVEPFVRLAYVSYHVGSLAESGGVAAVSSLSDKYDATFATLGLRASTQVGASASLRGSIGYQHTGGDRSPVASLAIAGTGQYAAIRSVPLDRSALAAEAGVDFRIGKNAALGVGYSGVIGKNNSDHGVKATLSVGF